MVEDDFLILVRGDVLPFEFAIEIGVDGRYGFIFREEVCEGNVFVLLGFALFREAFGTEDYGVWVCGVPGAEEDVVLRFRD